MKKQRPLPIAAAVAMTTTLAGALASAGSASADNENLVIGGDFENVAPLDPSNTDFEWSDPSVMAAYDQTGMWAPVRYTIASNPRLVHPYWANLGLGSNMMIVNGRAEPGTDNLVWAQDVALPAASYTLWAGQHLAVGDIEVSTDADGNLVVKYVLNDDAVAAGWRITQTHLATGDTPADIPQAKGNPTPGKFAYSDTFSPGVTEHTYSDVAHGLIVAAHAVVTRTTESASVSETAWAGDENFSGKNWARYVSYAPAYDFSMIATNVLPKDNVVPGIAGGAHLTVLINETEIGEVDLTNEEAGKLVVVEGVVEYASTARIEIHNEATGYHGNDFAIDDISLTQH